MPATPLPIPMLRRWLLPALLLALASCRPAEVEEIAPPDRGAIRPGDPIPVDLPDRAIPPEPPGPVPSAPDPEGLDTEAGERGPVGAWTETTLASLSLRQKVGQMIMPWVLGDFPPEGSAGYERVIRMVRDQEIGGVIISVGTPLDVAAKVNAFQGAAGVPLLVAADLETGAGFRMRGAVYLPGLHDLGGRRTFRR